jgi:serine/threonine protein phosphatase PrpC
MVIAVASDPDVLPLVSDGATGGSARERAERVVSLAEAAGATDNATALVVVAGQLAGR